jgi:predicted TIM-barrel fold metal-dependent hydrolase
VHVKTAAFFRVSSEPYPFLDTRLLITELLAAYGVNRLMWGTDFPWVNQQYG